MRKKKRPFPFPFSYMSTIGSFSHAPVNAPTSGWSDAFTTMAEKV